MSDNKTSSPSQLVVQWASPSFWIHLVCNEIFWVGDAFFKGFMMQWLCQPIIDFTYIIGFQFGRAVFRSRGKTAALQ